MEYLKWLSQRHEETIDPNRPICDPHHHLWDKPGSRYLLDELLSDTGSGHNICKTVFVECLSKYRTAGLSALKPVGETEFAENLADVSASGNVGSTLVADGIVGYADLSMGSAVEEILIAHIAASPKRFKGIRHGTSWHSSADINNSHTNPSEHLMMDDNFREGFRSLARLNLTFDAWLYHHQLPEFVDLATDNPDVTIILNHFGGPLGVGPYQNRAEEVFESWQEAITPLQKCPNVNFKLGGINMKINGFNWHLRDVPPSSDELVEATSRYYNHCIDTFGSARCMFESNFPVDRDSCSYNILWNAFKKIASTRSRDEQDDLFLGAACRTYKLSL